MSVFQGVAGVLTTVFGAPVSYLPNGGASRNIRSMFRETPVEAQNAEGNSVLILAPTWRVERHLAPEVARGDRIQPGNGKTYKIKNVWPSGSPASDAAVICELEISAEV